MIRRFRPVLLTILATACLIAGPQDRETERADSLHKWYESSSVVAGGMSLEQYQSWLNESGQMRAFEKLSRRGPFRVRTEKQLKRYGATPEIIAMLKAKFGEDLQISGPIWWEPCEGWFSLSGWCYCVDVRHKWDHDCDSSDPVPINE